MVGNHLVASCCVLTCALLAGACVSEPLARESAEDPVNWAEFRASALPLPDGTFLVDGDLRVADEQGIASYFDGLLGGRDKVRATELRSSAEAGVARQASPLLLMVADGVDSILPNSEKFALTYCVSSSFGAHFEQVVAELETATRSWSDRVAVHYEYVPTDPCTVSSNVTFNVSPAPIGANWFATSWFPHQGRSMRQLLINDAAFTTTSGGRDFQGILRHELGHTLGFRHEHIVLNPLCTDELPDESSTTTVEDYRELTPYDVSSVMHYPQCRPSQSGGYRQSARDFEGAIGIYGLAPALVHVVNSR